MHTHLAAAHSLSQGQWLDLELNPHKMEKVKWQSHAFLAGVREVAAAEDKPAGQHGQKVQMG